MGDLSSIDSSQSVKIVGQDINGAETFAVNATPDGKLLVSAEVSSSQNSSYYPDPTDNNVGDIIPLQSESTGALRIRGPIHTDEGSFRDDFIGSNNVLSLTGTLLFTNGSTSVIGTGTLFTSELNKNFYIKKSTDSNSVYEGIFNIISDTELELEHPYLGTNGSGIGYATKWKQSLSGGSISYANSYITLNSGVDASSFNLFNREGDYLPYIFEAKLNISQRIANQTTSVGFFNSENNTPSESAVLVFDGTDNTKVKLRTRSFTDAANLQETTITFPLSGVSSVDHVYSIEVNSKRVTLSIDGEVAATHQNHIPDSYTVLFIGGSIYNSAIVTNTTLNVDYIVFENINRLAVQNDFAGSPIKSQIMGKSSVTGLFQDLILDNNGNLIVTSLTGFGANFAFGAVATAATTLVPVRRNVYAEQSTNGQRSIASSSSADALVQTGARTVIITYYDQNGNGPFSESLNLNGATGVNTVATNICFIEKIVVTSVGSGGTNAGTITLFTGINKGGTTITTIEPGGLQTFLAIHYVPAGKTCNVTGIAVSHNGTTVGSGAVFKMTSKALIPYATSSAIQISDFVRLYGQSSMFSRVYQSPIKVVGPARIQLEVAPESTSAIIYRGSFDYFEST